MRTILGEHQPNDKELRQTYLLAQHYITNSTPLFLFNALRFMLLIHHKLTLDTTRTSFAADDIFSEVQRIAAMVPAKNYNLKQQSCLTHRLSIMLSNLPSHLYIDDAQRHLPSWLLYNITNSATMIANSILTAADVDTMHSELKFNEYSENPLQTFWNINKASFQDQSKIQQQIEFYFKIKALHSKRHQLHITHCKIIQHLCHQYGEHTNIDRLSSVIQDEELAQETKLSAATLFSYHPHQLKQPKFIQQYFLKESLFLILFNLLNMYKRVALNTSSQLNQLLKKHLPFVRLDIQLELFSTSFFIDSNTLLKRKHEKQPSFWSKAILETTPTNVAKLIDIVTRLTKKCRTRLAETNFEHVLIPIEINEHLNYIERILEDLGNQNQRQNQHKSLCKVTTTTKHSSKEEFQQIIAIKHQYRKLQGVAKLDFPRSFNAQLQDLIESLGIVIKSSCDQYIFGHNKQKLPQLKDLLEMTKAQINGLIENLKDHSQQTIFYFSTKEYITLIFDFQKLQKNCKTLQSYYHHQHYAIIRSESERLLYHHNGNKHITASQDLFKQSELAQSKSKSTSIQLLQKLLLQNKYFLLISFIFFTTLSIIAAKTSASPSTDHTAALI